MFSNNHLHELEHPILSWLLQKPFKGNSLRPLRISALSALTIYVNAEIRRGPQSYSKSSNQMSLSEE